MHSSISSDHSPVKLDISLQAKIGCTNNTTTNWTRYGELLARTDLILPSIKCTNDIDNEVDRLTRNIIEACEQASVPKLPNSYKESIPRATKQLIRDKNKLRRSWQRTRDPLYKLEVNRLQKRINKELYEHRNQSWNEFLTELTPEDNSLWRIHKFFKKKDQPSIKGPIATLNGISYTDLDKAEAIACELETQFQLNADLVDKDTEEEVSEFITNLANTTVLESNFPKLPPSDLKSKINKLKPNKAPGLDKISNKMLKALPDNIIIFLFKIIQAIFIFSHFPKSWKTAVINPIPKPGLDHSKAKNYRPIALLSSLSKLAEAYILEDVKVHCRANNILINEQFGFRTGHSTVHQLNRVTETILGGLLLKKFTGAVFLDISKAFDRIWHDALLYKLNECFFPAYMLKIIASYLNNRCFNVKINTSYSDIRSIKAGVPQGSLLGPLLFCLYTNDIPKPPRPNTKVALFADDTAVLSTDEDSIYICEELELYLEDLADWYVSWKIQVNPNKSAAIIFSRNKRPDTFNIKMSGKPISWVDHVKYLGVTLDSHLTWMAHINLIRAKAQVALAKLYPIMRKRSKFSISNKMIIYKMAIRSILAYAWPVWGYASKSNIKRLEVFQNKALRIIVNAPWFVRNEVIRRDLEIPTITVYIKEIAKRFFTKVDNHTNPLISSLSYIPAIKGRRPRNLLL